MAFGKGKRGKGQREEAVDEFSKGLDWEASRTAMLEKSERRAWHWAFIALVAMVLSWVAIVFMMPLKQTVPYVIRVDSATGATDIVTTLNSKRVTYDEVMDKYWLARYVRAHETYDWYTLQHDYDTVGMLSSAPVAKHYASQFGGENGLDKRNGADVRTTVEILSVVPNGRGTATVRYATSTGSTNTTTPPDVRKWVATLGYKYINPSSMKESYRLVNPFGFQVMSYRVDPEFSGGGQ